MDPSDLGQPAFRPSALRPAPGVLDPGVAWLLLDSEGRLRCPLCAARQAGGCTGTLELSAALGLLDALPALRRVLVEGDGATAERLALLRAPGRQIVRRVRFEPQSAALPSGAVVSFDVGAEASVDVAAAVRLLVQATPSLVELSCQAPPRATVPSRLALAPVTVVAPRIAAALEQLEAAGIPAIVRDFPRCLLPGFERHFDERRPTPIGPACDRTELPRLVCLWAPRCALGERCGGLSAAYVRRHGWEEALLRPLGAQEAALPNLTSTAAFAEAGVSARPAAPAASVASRSSPARELCQRMGVAPGFELESFTLGEPRMGAGYLDLPWRRGELEVVLRLRPRAPGRNALACTPSFDATHGRVPVEAHPALRAFVRHLALHDPGGLAELLPSGAAPPAAAPRVGSAAAGELSRRLAGNLAPDERERFLAPLVALAALVHRVSPGATGALWERLSTSIRLRAVGIDGHRCGLSLSMALLEPGAFKRVRELLWTLGAPRAVAAHLETLPPGPRADGPLLYVSTEQRASRQLTWRVYLQEPERPASDWGATPPTLEGSSAPPEILGWEWSPSTGADVRRRWYLHLPADSDSSRAFELASGAPATLAPRVLAICGGAGITRTYLRLDEGSEGRRRVALFLQLQHHPVDTQRERLLELAALVGADFAAFEAWLARVRPAVIDGVAAGVDRDGSVFVTPYFLGLADGRRRTAGEPLSSGPRGGEVP